jgi:CRISPR system Cascade subunit CasC
VDDLNRDESGAGHMGVFEFGSGLFYLYICVDRALLLENLKDDNDLAQKALEALCRAACTVSPTGKQNSFASRAYASFCLAEKGDAQPRSLSTAFLSGIDRPGDILGEAIKRLKDEKERMDGVYGLEVDAAHFDAHAGQGSLDQVCAFVKE